MPKQALSEHGSVEGRATGLSPSMSVLTRPTARCRPWRWPSSQLFCRLVDRTASLSDGYPTRAQYDALLEAFAHSTPNSSTASCPRRYSRCSTAPSQWISTARRLFNDPGHVAWMQHGVKITYSGGIPMRTDPSLTLQKPGSDAIELSLSETHQNGVTFIVPTSYSGPEGSITVRTARDLQQIYALLIAVGG